MTDSDSPNSPLPPRANHSARVEQPRDSSHSENDQRSDHDHDGESCAVVLERVADDGLTARQLEVLRTAHRMGYFKSPREHSAEEIADMLDISGATFSEHIRTVQDKLFSAIF